MAGSIQNFVRAMSGAPKPSEELWERGAYPQRVNGGSWVVPTDLFLPITDAYLKRSIALTGDEPVGIFEHSSFDPDFLTNEESYPDVIADIEKRGDVYIGTTRAVSFTFPAAQRATHAFVVDYDPKVPFGFTIVWGMLMLMAPDRAHFLSLLFGAPLMPDRQGNFEEMSGEDLILEIRKHAHDAGFSSAVHSAILSSAVDISYPYSLPAVESMLKGLVKFFSKPESLNVLAGQDGAGRGGPLFSERAYQNERRLFFEGRMTGVVTDLAGDGMNPVIGAIEALGQRVGVVYVSNVEGWLWTSEVHMGSYAGGLFERTKKFYGNISRLEELGDGGTQIISSMESHLSVLPIGSHLIRFKPHESLPGSEAMHIYKLREIIIAAMRDKKNAGKSPREIVGLLTQGSMDCYESLFRAINNIMGDGPMEWQQFEDRMMQESGEYRRLSIEFRKTLLLSLMDLGVIRPPYPIAYNSPRRTPAIPQGGSSGAAPASGSSAPPAPATPAPSGSGAASAAAYEEITALPDEESWDGEWDAASEGDYEEYDPEEDPSLAELGYAIFAGETAGMDVALP